MMVKPILTVHLVALGKDTDTKEPYAHLSINGQPVFVKLGEIYEFGFTRKRVHI